MDIAEDVKGPYASSPADIRATAENIAENYSFDPSILAGAICAALVSERERCAKVADDAVVDLTDDMLRELVRLAGKATPGPWDTDEPNIVYSMAGGGCVYLANTEGLDTSAQQCRADASFIEAADPPTVAALASELLKLREAVRVTDEMMKRADMSRALTPRMALAGKQKLLDLGYEGVEFTDAQSVFLAMMAESSPSHHEFDEVREALAESRKVVSRVWEAAEAVDAAIARAEAAAAAVEGRTI